MSERKTKWADAKAAHYRPLRELMAKVTDLKRRVRLARALLANKNRAYGVGADEAEALLDLRKPLPKRGRR